MKTKLLGTGLIVLLVLGVVTGKIAIHASLRVSEGGVRGLPHCVWSIDKLAGMFSVPGDIELTVSGKGTFARRESASACLRS